MNRNELPQNLSQELDIINNSGAYTRMSQSFVNTSRQHGLLVCRLQDLPTNFYVLLSALDETLIHDGNFYHLANHLYPGMNFTHLNKYIFRFGNGQIPVTEYGVDDIELTKELILMNQSSQVLIKYTLKDAPNSVSLRFQPLLAFRNINSLSQANLDVNAKVYPVKNGIKSQLYNHYPYLFLQFSKTTQFSYAPDWFFDMEYSQDKKNGNKFKEDLFVPGFFQVNLQKGESIIFSASLQEEEIANLSSQFDKEVQAIYSKTSKN